MKKILIITYYWPPAGGPGVQRWLKFVKYLRDFNIEPVLFVPKNAHYPIIDGSLASEIPKGIKIYEQPIFEPYGLAGFLSSKKTKRISSGIIQTKNQSPLEKLMLWIRGNFFIPDARKYWVKPSVKFLSSIIESEHISTIITTGPPHSVHLIGYHLSKKYQIKWLADFRDPWTSIGYHKSLKLTTASQKKHRYLEQLILNEASEILVTSNTTKEEFQSSISTPISVITNGYDSDYEGGAHLDEQFTISHIGSLLSERNPQILWKVLSQLAAEDAVFRSDLQLEFMGVVSQEVLNSLNRYELAPYLKLRGYGSHLEAIRKQQQAQILLLVEIDSLETEGIIPGKLFEYMAARRPILAIGPKNWEAGRIIMETQTGEVCDYKDEDQLKDILLKWHRAYKNGKLQIISKPIEQYSRRKLTGKLAELL